MSLILNYYGLQVRVLTEYLVSREIVRKDKHFWHHGLNSNVKTAPILLKTASFPKTVKPSSSWLKQAAPCLNCLV
jgi:hypothetical protein